MASVMNTGTCLRPSCTAIVCPSISGMIVERRDQVLMTFFEFLSFCASTFLSRWSSTNGPFFKLRGIFFYSRLPALAGGVAAADDHPVARLALATGTALGLTRGVHRVATTRGL